MWPLVERGWFWCGEGRRRSITERGVWTFGVVVDAPLLDDDLCLPETVEDFTIEALIPEFAVEGLAVAVLPG